jgi:DNA-binding transcriptional MocR family regulator
MVFTSWQPREATENIRSLAKQSSLQLIYQQHAIERLAERGIIVSDVLYVLKHGFVHTAAEPAMRLGFFKYLVESKSPNSGSRSLGIVVIPNPQVCSIKIVTIMWMDELERRDGTLIGGDIGND